MAGEYADLSLRDISETFWEDLCIHHISKDDVEDLQIQLADPEVCPKCTDEPNETFNSPKEALLDWGDNTGANIQDLLTFFGNCKRFVQCRDLLLEYIGKSTYFNLPRKDLHLACPGLPIYWLVNLTHFYCY